jgi:O-methyltransferase
MPLVERISRALGRGQPEKPTPIDLVGEKEFLALAERARPYTMTSWERQFGLWTAVRYIHREGIQGDFVECGVWKGGSTILAGLTFQELGDTSRTLYMYDTFAGMTEPTPEDGSEARTRWEDQRAEDHNDWAYAPQEEVEANLRREGIDMSRVKIVKGPVEETIPGVLPERIALLRLDTDWYDSTKHELEHMYDLVPAGGIVIFDDYGHWEGARTAVDEFFADRGITPLLWRTDRAGRVLVKPTSG